MNWYWWHKLKTRLSRDVNARPLCEICSCLTYYTEGGVRCPECHKFVMGIWLRGNKKGEATSNEMTPPIKE